MVRARLNLTAHSNFNNFNFKSLRTCSACLNAQAKPASISDAGNIHSELEHAQGFLSISIRFCSSKEPTGAKICSAFHPSRFFWFFFDSSKAISAPGALKFKMFFLICTEHTAQPWKHSSAGGCYCIQPLPFPFTAPTPEHLKSAVLKGEIHTHQQEVSVH